MKTILFVCSLLVSVQVYAARFVIDDATCSKPAVTELGFITCERGVVTLTLVLKGPGSGKVVNAVTGQNLCFLTEGVGTSICNVQFPKGASVELVAVPGDFSVEAAATAAKTPAKAGYTFIP